MDSGVPSSDFVILAEREAYIYLSCLKQVVIFILSCCLTGHTIKHGMEWTGLVDVVRQSSFWGSRFFSCKNTTHGSGSKLQPVDCNYHSYTILDLPSDTDPRKTFYGFMVKLGNRRKGFGTWGGDRQISTTCFPSHILVWYDCSLYLPTTLKLPNT